METTPELKEVATTRDGRDITRGYVDDMQLSRPQDAILRLRGGGNYNIYKEVLRDDQVATAFQQRRLAVTSREWLVIPGGDSTADKKAADFVKEILNTINFDAATNKMLYGIFYGYAIAECMWARDGTNIILDNLTVRDRTRFAFSGDNQLRLLTTINPNGERLPERKFWTFQTGADHDDEPYGLGLAHWLYWPTFFKRNGMRFWLIFLEKFGQPTAKGTYPGASTTEAEKNKLLNALQAIQTDSAVVIPEGMVIELLQAARSGTADYVELYDRMDRAISKVILSQVMTSEAVGGQYKAEVQMNVREEVVKADSDLICSSFNRTVLRWLTEWNYPTAQAPSVWRNFDNPEDLNRIADRDTKVYSIGFEASEEYIKQTYGDGWNKKQPIDHSHGNNKPSTTAEFTESDDTNLIDNQIERLASQSDKQVAAMINRVRSLAGQVESLEQLRDIMLDEFSAIETDQLSTIIESALIASHAAGGESVL